jgi:hypothetical protein
VRFFLCPQPQFHYLKEALLQLHIRNFDSNVVRNCMSAFCSHNFFSAVRTEMRYCEISKEMLSLYFGLAVFCLLVAIESQNLACSPSPEQLWNVQCTLSTEHGVKYWDSNFELAEYIKHKIKPTTSLC